MPTILHAVSRTRVEADPVLASLDTTLGLVSRAGFRDAGDHPAPEDGLVLAAGDLVG